MIRKWGPLLLILLAMPMMAFAQGTGKLSGRVIDESTGESLPGANVILQGTTLGATTDINGEYFIIGVPVGSYTIQASFVGFAPETVLGVEINAGYTRELNFELLPGVELDEVIVEYERPLLQKDAVGVPKIVSAEEIESLPVRGATNVTKIQAGVVAKEGESDLNIRGGRGSEVDFYIDGVKTSGTTGLGIPQAAVEQQELQTGLIDARYGDVMSGVVAVTTKSGGQEFSGSLEAITSEELDPYGYNLISGSIGGPIIKNKLTFFVAGEYTDQADGSPSAFGELRINDDVLADLNAAPTAFRGLDENGNTVLMPIPAGVSNGATLQVDGTSLSSSHFIVTDNMLTFSDGTQVAVPAGVDPASIGLTPVARANFLAPGDYSVEQDKLSRNNTALSLLGSLSFDATSTTRIRVGGRYNTNEFRTGIDERILVFNSDAIPTIEREDINVFGSVTQRLSNTTFFQIQADYSTRFQERFDDRFGTSEAAWLEYGNTDNAAFSALNGYVVTGRIEDDADGNHFAVYEGIYEDGAGLGLEDVGSLVVLPGGYFGFNNRYEKQKNDQFRISGSLTTQLGDHQIEVGGEFEKLTRRFFRINAARLAAYVDDGDVQISLPDGRSVNSLSDLPLNVLEDFVGFNYGYDLYGRNEVDSESFAGVVSQDPNKPLSDYNLKPYEPTYFGGYIQDKIEFNDLVLNLGLRVDVFDNNTRVLKDRFALRPICRVADVGSNDACAGSGTIPGGVESDYSVFYSGNNIIGYRDLNGAFYGQDGQITTPDEVLLSGQVRTLSNLLTEDLFTDYDPVVTLMPRIGISFPVTDRAVFFASYGIVSQRPSTGNFSSLDGFVAGTNQNTNLQPEKTTKYELGFRQRLTDRAALTISGFYSQIENLIQERDVTGATPIEYESFENVDFGNVKGLEFAFDLRRTNGFLANLNYTLSFAEGTGSASQSTSIITWIDETPPNFISPLDFDQRHKLNLSLDYRLGPGEGPSLGNFKPLENFGVNILATAGSGFAYTPVQEPFNQVVSRPPVPVGGINSARMPWQNRVDLRVDRGFNIPNSNARVSVFLWVQNVFDTDNINDVWRFTGLADNDGFLATAGGASFLSQREGFAEDLYSHRNRDHFRVGIPRITRLGLRLNF